MDLWTFARECYDVCRADGGMGQMQEILSRLADAVKEDAAKSCEKTAQNWSANNDDYKDVALMCAEDIRKIRYLIRN